VRWSGVLVAAALLATGCASGGTAPQSPSAESRSLSADPTPSPSVSSSQSSPTATPTTSGKVTSGAAVTALAALPVKGRAPKTGYDRDLFGPAWADVDANGCDTRNDILRRDLTAITYKPDTRNCVVATGMLADPYSGRSIAFVRGQQTSQAVQIDHVVSLSNSWQTGSFAWSPDRRRAFANDPLNLLAVDGPLNQQKSDGDAATWLPPNRSYRCEFVARQVAVKSEYGLWVTAPERDAIARVLASCPTQPLPTG
jgi:hypothetical protein